MGIGIAKDEADSRKEIAFTGSIATNNHVVLRRKWLNHSLILIAIIPTPLAEPDSCERRTRKQNEDIPFEALDDDLLDMHLATRTRNR